MAAAHMEPPNELVASRFGNSKLYCALDNQRDPLNVILIEVNKM